MLFEQILEKKSSLFGEKRIVLEDFLSKGFPTKKDEEYKYPHPIPAVTENKGEFLLPFYYLPS